MPPSPALPYGYDDSSSLDPLAEALDTHTSLVATRSSSPFKRRLSSPVKASTRKRSSSDRNLVQSPQGISIVAQSPSRTVTEQTLSPWKIRVTVETEPEDPAEGPMEMMTTRTRTTKIPLRQDSSPTPASVELSSGRGRKSQPGTAKSGRSGTPVRGKNNSRSRSRSRRQSVTDLDIVVLGDDCDSDEWTGRQKSRSRSRSRSPKKSTGPGSRRSKSASVDPEYAEVMTNKRQERSDFEIHQDEDDGIAVYDESVQPGTESPELRQIDLNKVAVRSRAPPTKQKEEPENQQPTREKTRIQPRSSPKFPKSSSRKVSATSAASYPTPSPTSSYHGGSDEVAKYSDPTNSHEGFDTILESEEFTMIDLSSVPSAKLFMSTPPDSQDTDNVAAPGPATISNIQQQPTHLAKPSPIPKYLATVDEESELSSNVPSSPPATDSSLLRIPQPASTGLRKVTPVHYSSPKLPSPPRQTMKSSEGHQRTISKEAVNAGIALQGIVSPEKAIPATPSNPSSHRVSSLVEEELYGGFSSGTKRELRAGLRFGEELAKRQKPSHSAPASSQETDSMAQLAAKAKPSIQTRPSTSTQVWRGEALIRHSSPPQPSLAPNANTQTKSDMVHSPGMFNPALSMMQRSRTKDLRSLTSHADGAKLTTETPKTSSQALLPEILDTDTRRQHEWQLEREAVSREIDEAGPSKVIVIDSSDDEAEMGPKVFGGAMAWRHTASSPGDPQGERKARRESSDPRSEADGTRQKKEQGYQAYRSGGKGTGQTEEQSDQAKPQGHSSRNNLQGSGEDGDEDENELRDNDDDVWLEEAKAGSSSPKEVVSDHGFTPAEQQRQHERAVGIVNKPRRSLLPSPWKRGQDVEASTFMSNGETSGMLWQQPLAAKFGAGDIAQTKRALDGNGAFDFERMMSSPVRLARPGRKASMELRIDQLNSDLEPSEMDEEQPEYEEDQEGSVGGIEQDEESQSPASEESMPSSPPQARRVPVKFNDSTLTHDSTPPPLARSTPTEKSDERPPTPRSALKGARKSFGMPPPQDSPRKVIFNRRSMYLNDEGEESTMSAKLDSPSVELQHPLYGQHQELEELEDSEEHEETPRKSGWMSWIWKGKLANEDLSTSNNDTTLTSAAMNQLDGSNDSPSQDGQQKEWQPTKTTMPSGRISTTHIEQSQPKPKKRKSPTPSIPSYLLSPSYPSDPTRSPTTPLTTSGDFTNTHFRTLHIIYAKSQRPRFHPPTHIRPEVQSLLGWKMELDMADTGVEHEVIGKDEVFEWRAGVVETQVVERFMQEVEWGYVRNGVVGEMRDVVWGWKVEELVRWLGMVVIGEIVRREESEMGVRA